MSVTLVMICYYDVGHVSGGRAGVVGPNFLLLNFNTPLQFVFHKMILLAFIASWITGFCDGFRK